MHRMFTAFLLVFPMVLVADDRDAVLQSIEARRSAYADVAKADLGIR